jgi:hypothetical protein
MMYLMLSLLCTVVNEFIATKMNLRAATLKDALQKLIDDPTLLSNFYAHGLIASNARASATGSQSTLQAVVNAPSAVKNLMTTPQAPAATAVAVTAEQHPSYLAGGTVALALMGVLLKQQSPPVTADFAGVETAINNLPVAPKLQEALQASLLQANGNINILRQSIATWFDDSMDRLSGAYKRKMKWIAMLIGLLVAIAFNADSFNVATTLWNDADRRASTIEVATQIAQKPLPTPGQPVDQKKLGDEIKNTELTLRSLPIGWNCPAQTAGGSIDYWACAQQKVSKLTLVQFLGWLLTAAALSLGAPFWFDLLNKFINLRGAGEKPKREDKK